MIGFKRNIGSVPALVLDTLALVLKGLPREFPNRCASKLFGSWRRSPSKIAARKFPNRCASEIVQGRFWKLAKKAIEDRCKKISQPMRVENCSRKVLEVGEEVHRRSLREKFSNRCASKIVQGRFWKLAKKSIEDRCKKNFPTDARRKY